MNFENFEEYFTTNLKINDDKKFQEKLDLLLSTDKNKKELIEKIKQKKKEEEDLIKQRKLKDESNEKKIDFILSDENSYDKYEEKLKEKNAEDENDIDNIFYNKFQEEKGTSKAENSNITNTDHLINNEKFKIDAEFKKMNDDIKKNNPQIYNPKKIKKYKEMIDLKIGLENQEDNEEKQINKKQIKTNNSKNKDNNFRQKKNNINKTFSSSKIFKNNLKKNIIKNEMKKENNDEDLIMSLIQCPILSCHKTETNFQKNIKMNHSINEKSDIKIKKTNIKKNNDENKSLSLLNIYKKEKEMKNKLQNIFLNNQMIKQNDLFSEENECNNQFYNFDSNSKYLTKARDILLESLSDEDKRLIKELDDQIINVKNQISDINEEKNKYNKMIEENKNKLMKFESEKNKEEFEYERELINELRSVVNNFKMEIYKKELGINNREIDEDKRENENEEIKRLNNKYNELKKELNTINNNNEKFIVNIQNKIMILKYENEQMKEKIESYQHRENFQKIDSEVNINDNLLLLNQNIKKSKLLQFNNDNDDQNITINKDLGLNNIIKTSSKLYHLKELDFEFPEKYFDDDDNKVIKHKFELDGKTIKIYKNNKKEIIFPNNTKKETFPDGYTIVYFSNGDIKELIPNNKEIYYYKKDEVYQIDFADGTKYIKYLKTGKIFCNGNPIN